MRRLHYFDPQLVNSFSGHVFNYCAQVVREMRSRNIPLSLYGKRDSLVTCEGIQAEPAFSRDIWLDIGRDPEVWAIENFQLLNQAFLADLLRIPADRFSSDDVVFFPTLLQNQLHGIALWLGRLPPNRRPVPVVLLRYLNHEMDYNRRRANHKMVAHFYRYAAQALHAIQPRTVLCADTKEMAAAYGKITGRPVLEVPVAMEPPATPAARSPHPRPGVVFLGHTSRLKGFHLLPGIIERCQGLEPKPRFVVQVQSCSAAERDGIGPVLEALDHLAGPDVRLVHGALEPADYFRLLTDADIVLLPYSLDYYGHCSSGIFVEAGALGKVVVVPEGTVAAREGREHALGVVTAEQCTAPSLAGAVAAALRDLPALRVRAANSAAAFRSHQSVRSFWNRLLAAIPAAPAGAAVAA